MLPAGLLLVAAKFAIWQLGKKRAIDFADKQLAEFYGPMVAARAEIFNHTMFDRYMRAASGHEHARELKRQGERKIDRAYLADVGNAAGELERFFDALNERLYSETIESYVAMRKLFAAKMAYADEETRAWYDYFYAFVEMWTTIRKNDKEGFLPARVGGALGAMFAEELLQPFYAHLRERTANLQAEIAGRKVTKTPAPKPPPMTTSDLLDVIEKAEKEGRKP